MTDRCTGHCCREFPIPYSPDALRRRVAEAMIDGYGMVEDGMQIIDMLIYLGFKSGWSDGRPFSDGEPRHVYMCRHFDAETGNCGIYDIRPRMCSNYPYGSPCKQPDCTAPNRGVDFVSVSRLKRSYPGSLL